MADCHELFKQYNKILKLTDTRKEELKVSRNSLRKKIKEYFKEEKPDEISPKFEGQGSFMTNTIINPKPVDDKVEYDIDDGIYFIGEEGPDERKTIETYHNWIYEAVKDHTGTPPVSKNTCIRVIFSDGHHIDLPIYYLQKDIPELAHKKEGWIFSDPRDFYKWFNNKTEKNKQLRKIVRYMKGWCDWINYASPNTKMPSGLIMTILTTNNIKYNDKDDVAMAKTLENIKDELDREFKCERPTTPEGEDLFEVYSDKRKEFFNENLEDFIKSSKEALNSKNQYEACIKWKKHLGDRFPCHLAKDEIEEKYKRYAKPAIITRDARSA